jgi:glucose/mannose transport system substrate-binding protein
MRRSRRGFLAVTIAAALIATSAACGDDEPSGTTGGSGDTEVEVFSWWTGPGEQEGLDAMVAEFKKQNPSIKFTNAAVAGGSGTQARQVLATRLQQNKAPDSYQVHAGKELASDIADGKVEDLSAMYDAEGWRDKFPKGLVDAITVDGKLYSVPVNIHRSNLLWFNPATLEKAGIAAPPKTWSEFLTQAETLKAKKITAISVGPAWAQMHLMENVLLGELGTDKYNGLWTGATDWKAPEVTAALETFKKVLAVSDVKSAAPDWQPALDKVIYGTAAYNVMGDWADAYLGRSKQLKFKEGYDVVASPGSEGVYNFLSDSFTLPVGAPHRGAAEKWLKLCGSVVGQDLFNPQKGSVPARTDADKAKYKDYLAIALADWQNPQTKIVGSLVHGVVANNAFKSEMETAYGLFAQNLDVAKFSDAVKTSYESVGK